MKKITKLSPTQYNKRSFATRCASAIVCFALLLLGATAFAAAPANDNFANATTIQSALPATSAGNSTDATSEPGEPQHSDWSNPAQIGNNSIWWVWTPSSSGPVTIDTANSSDAVDTELAVYTGTSVDSLTRVAVNEDAPDLAHGWSKVTFNAVSGTTYHIAVAGFENSSGPVTVNISSGGTVGTGLTLTVTTSGSGTVTRNPDKASYDTNEVVTLTAVPTGTNTFIGWGGAAAAEGTNNPITITMDSAKTVSAEFTSDGTGTGSFPLIVHKVGSGTVMKIPNKARYAAGDVVTVVAKPTKRETFLGWTGTDQSNTDTTNTVTIAGPTTITATFSTSGGGGGGGGGVVLTTIEVLTNGIGKVSPNLNGRNVVVGKRYRLNAIPGKDQIFAGWTGFTNSDDRKLTFIMEEGLSITANFVPNPFAAIAGNYNGLFFETNAITQDCSGFFTAKVSKNGKFTIRLTKGGKTLAGSGQLDANGAGTATIRQGTSETVVQIQTDINGGTDKITGTVTSPDCTAQLQGDRQVFSAQNPAPLAGQYNLLFPRSTNVNGNGFATLIIDKNGKAKLRGELADGSKLSQTTAVSKDGQVPVYVSLYNKEGSLIGWLNVSSTNTFGTFSWIKPGTNGFEMDVPVTGSLFDKSIAPLLSISNAVVEIGGDGLTDPLLIPVTISSNSIVSVVGTNENSLNLKLLPTGLVQGNFVSPATQQNTLLQGIILQNSNSAAGFFSGPDSPGYFELREQIAP